MLDLSMIPTPEELGKKMAEDEMVIFEEYLQELRLEGQVERINWAKNRLGRLFEYLRQKELLFEEVGIKEAQAYQGWLIEQGRRDGGSYAGGSIHNFLKEATRFYKYLKGRGRY